MLGNAFAGSRAGFWAAEYVSEFALSAARDQARRAFCFGPTKKPLEVWGVSSRSKRRTIPTPTHGDSREWITPLLGGEYVGENMEKTRVTCEIPF